MSIWQRAPENSGAEPETGMRAAWGQSHRQRGVSAQRGGKRTHRPHLRCRIQNRTDEVREALHLLSGAQNQVLWVIPYLPGEEVPSEQNRAYTAIGWEVKTWK